MRIDYGSGYRVYYKEVRKKLSSEAVIELAVQENDPEYLLKAIGDIARSEGMAQIAQELNLDRASLYKALDGNPSFFYSGKKGNLYP